MTFNVIKASRSIKRTGSFFFAAVFAAVSLTSALSAAEVSRSLSLEDRVRILEQQLSSANRMRAESQFEITSLKNEVRDLRGLLEEQGYQLEQIVNRQRELYRDIDSRLKQPVAETRIPVDNNIPAETQLNSIPEQSTVSDTSVQNTVTETNTVIQDKAPVVTDNAEMRASYDKIFPLVKGKQYDEAIAAYQHFIAKYPDSIYVANSKYWLAQIYSVQGRMEESEREYLNVVQQYPTSSKASDAWYKLGKLYENQKQMDKAINAYNQVVTQYSTSTSAQMAISRLQALKSSN